MTIFAVATPGEFRVIQGSPKQRVPATARDLALQLQRPSGTSVVLHISGELDVNSAPRLHELLAPRLRSGITTLVLDLSELRFLGGAGIELLEHVHRRAVSRGVALRLVQGPPCVSRALRAAGQAAALPTFSSVDVAVADVSAYRARPDE